MADIVKQQLMFSLIEVWQKGEQSQQDFCKEKDLDYNQFQYWFRKYRAINSSESRDSKFFKQIKVKDLPISTSLVEILYPDGKKLVFHQPVDVSFLRSLLS